MTARLVTGDAFPKPGISQNDCQTTWSLVFWGVIARLLGG